jgi:hypothetical protein
MVKSSIVVPDTASDSKKRSIDDLDKAEINDEGEEVNKSIHP